MTYMMNTLNDFTIFMKNSTDAAWEHKLNSKILMLVVDTYGKRMTI